MIESQFGWSMTVSMKTQGYRKMASQNMRSPMKRICRDLGIALFAAGLLSANGKDIAQRWGGRWKGLRASEQTL